MKNHAARNKNIQRQPGITRNRYSKHRNCHGIDKTTRLPRGAIQLLEKKCTGIQVEIVDKEDTESDTKILDCPAGLDMGIAHDLFNQDQAGNCHDKQPDKQQVNTQVTNRAGPGNDPVDHHRNEQCGKACCKCC